MDPTKLKSNFEEQISKTETQIKELEDSLKKATEYKIKLMGGLETLGLLEQEEAPAADASPASIEPS
jgi:ferritin-like metal-binding protein YciE|tara:strand:+ start:2757 stop:2957 length:201 start_codon:yes stop_codon:yes gene_type:complete